MLSMMKSACYDKVHIAHAQMLQDVEFG